MKRRPLACVAQQHAQPLIPVAHNLFAFPVQARDVILHRRLHRMKVCRTHAFVGHDFPTTIFLVDPACYSIVNFGMGQHDLGVQVVAGPWQHARLAMAAHLEKVFGGWRPPPVVA